MPNKKVFISGAAGVMGHASFLEIYQMRKDLDFSLLLLNKSKNHKLFSQYHKDPRVSIVWGNLKNYEDVKKLLMAVAMSYIFVGLYYPVLILFPKKPLQPMSQLLRTL